MDSKSWKQRLESPAKHRDAVLLMRHDAFRWHTCAVGEALGFPDGTRLGRINSILSSGKRYRSLCEAGNLFHWHVVRENWTGALKVWRDIQKNYKKEVAQIRREIDHG